MGCLHFLKLIASVLLFFPCVNACAAEENFLLIDGTTTAVVVEQGSLLHERLSPCSTFKMVLGIMGYDAGILKDGTTPTWNYCEGYDDFLEIWKTPQTPRAWMNHSCVWYSKILSLHLGVQQMQRYLDAFEYGNCDLAGGLTEPGPLDPAWINSSLKISPKEQVDFILRMLRGQLSVSNESIQQTKALVFKEQLAEGWRLFGKTGFSGTILGLDGQPQQFGWFVGWVEKDHRFLPFAYLIRDRKIDLDQRIPRVKQLLAESNGMQLTL